MFHKIIIYLKNFDWILFSSVLLLLSFGLVEIYSVALGQDDLSLLNFNKQVIAIAIGIIFLFLFSFFDYHNLRSYNKYLYFFGILFLVSVLIFGQTARGTKGWFYFGNFSLQPVEFIKILLIIFLAKYFSGAAIKLNPLKHLILSGLGVLLFVFLVLRQPDFGSAMILFLLWTFMVVAAGFKLKYLLIIGLIILFTITSGWLFFFEDYQKQRISTFLNPGLDPLGQGFNITQAIIAIGAGGIKGRGVGFGSQSQLKFLPEAQNDFIFAVIAEELGFFGISLVLLFFSVFFYRLISSIKKINNDFGIYFLIGIMALIFIEMFINIGMNIGILPVIGISLPFLSYGGSAIVS
ncbi:MAG: FtsW/RodA/SpoVE family cell cycle protein, partial [Patescibacteria group bacterium]|nr:FtsW/RodA/SpoVE family cell cycle protein [Patescibacteria group bacterium]